MSEMLKFNQHGQWQLLEKASSAPPPPAPAGHPSDVTPRPKGVPPLVPFQEPAKKKAPPKNPPEIQKDEKSPKEE